MHCGLPLSQKVRCPLPDPGDVYVLVVCPGPAWCRLRPRLPPIPTCDPPYIFLPSPRPTQVAMAFKTRAPAPRDRCAPLDRLNTVRKLARTKGATQSNTRRVPSLRAPVSLACCWLTCRAAAALRPSAGDVFILCAEHDEMMPPHFATRLFSARYGRPRSICRAVPLVCTKRHV